jgi:hypothetical protein
MPSEADQIDHHERWAEQYLYYDWFIKKKADGLNASEPQAYTVSVNCLIAW